MRRYFFRTFARIHLVLALTTLGATTWHIFSQTPKQAKIAVALSCGLWVFSSIYRCVRFAYYSTGAIITVEKSHGEATQIDLRSDRPVSFYPGCYFYIFPAGKLLRYNLFTGTPMVVLWYQCASATEFIERLANLKRRGKPVTLELLQQAAVPESLDSPGRRKLLERVAASGPDQLLELSKAAEFLEILQHENSAKPLEELALKASEADLTFLISHNSRPLQSLRLKSNDKVLLDGPYGQDLGLQHYQTVMLAAHGAGISVLLSFALYLWERQGQGLLRKVNILWSLERGYQEEWVSEKLKILKALDSLNVRAPTSCL